MVLMSSNDVPVWGRAGAGEAVSVQLGAAKAKTTAGADGRWIVHLDLTHPGPGPYTMTVKGNNELTVNDVLIGAVWLASGQSNMEYPLSGTVNAAQEIAQSANDQLRFFRVKKVMTDAPAEECGGHWVIASPQTSGDFSGVAYYFAKKLQVNLHMPVGIVDTSWGGANAELWISPDTIASVDVLRTAEAARQKFILEYSGQKESFAPSYGAWLEANHRIDTPTKDIAAYAGEVTSTSDWRTVNLPGPIADKPGVYWIRREVDVTAKEAEASLEFKVMIGVLEGFEQAYWNGVKVSETTYKTYPGEGYARYFAIPRKLIKDGKNTLALRVYAPGRPPRINNIAKNFWAGPVPLAGDWLERTEYELPSLGATELAGIPKAPAHTVPLSASGIYNGEISPLLHYAFSGVIWYQGESNSGRAYQYRVVFSLLIQDWRQKWGRGDLPFLFCQLPVYGDKPTKPGESQWAEVRESQSEALKLPNTGEAVLIDQGESDNLHPRAKRVAGERLAQLALTETYGQKVPDQSPVYESMSISGGKIAVRFTHADGGLSAHELPATYDVNTSMDKTAPLIPDSPGSQLQGFAICGADGRWVWANAKIEGSDTVLVWFDQVPFPIAVRYAWADTPTVNLYNGYGLPAAPFRTDSFPALTEKNLFGPGS
jgi:sialate O-acetylesterase